MARAATVWNTTLKEYYDKNAMKEKPSSSQLLPLPTNSFVLFFLY
jgi:hypothetical protein